MIKIKLYRYTDYGYELRLEQFYVIRETLKCKVINFNGKQKFILNNSVKRFAHESKDAALVSYRARKQRQVMILTTQIDAAKLALQLTENITADSMPPYIRLIADCYFDY